MRVLYLLILMKLLKVVEMLLIDRIEKPSEN